MTISLNPEHEKLVQEKVQNGEFPSVEAVVEFALNRFLGNTNRRDPALTVEERVRALDELFAEVDHAPASGAAPLHTEALSRRSLYDDYRNRR
jgi:Arc/MetJ-type ribon-helix-helix transcriptional regulator